MPKLPIPSIRPWQQHTCGRSTTAGTVALASTAATSATSTTLVDSVATWTTNQYQNFWVTILTGTGAGQTRAITSNTATTLTVPTWTVTPDNTSTFQITQPQYPGLQGSLVPGSTGGTVLKNVTYAEVIPIAGAAEVTARLKTTTAAGTLTLTPIRLLAATDPNDQAIYLGDGSIDTTKVQKYGTGGSSATAVVAGTELAVTINPAGEAYCLLEFAVTTAGTLNYCDVMTLQATGNINATVTGGGGGPATVADGADVALGSKADAAVTDPTASATLIALVKGAVKVLTDVWVSASHYLKTGLTDGTTVAGVDASSTGLKVAIAADLTAAPVADATLLASAAHTTTQTSADLVNNTNKGITVIVDVTAIGTGNITMTINGKDPASGKYYLLLSGAAISGNSTNVYKVFPGAPATANVSANDQLPHLFQIVITANNANPVTYSVGYTLTV